MSAKPKAELAKTICDLRRVIVRCAGAGAKVEAAALDRVVVQLLPFVQIGTTPKTTSNSEELLNPLCNGEDEEKSD
jgi:hypothetical protein